MAFVVKKISSYSWPVTVETPDSGRFEKHTFDATFKRMGRTEFNRLAEKGDKELLETVLLGWDGLLNEDETPMVYSVASVRELVDDPFFSRGFIKAYLESMEGAPAKN
jgi:hypothetical protein